MRKIWRDLLGLLQLSTPSWKGLASMSSRQWQLGGIPKDISNVPISVSLGNWSKLAEQLTGHFRSIWNDTRVVIGSPNSTD